MPRLLVDVRHEAAHNELPSLSLLRLASQQALHWLLHYYWERQAQSLQDTQSHITFLIKVCSLFRIAVPQLHEAFLRPKRWLSVSPEVLLGRQYCCLSILLCMQYRRLKVVSRFVLPLASAIWQKPQMHQSYDWIGCLRSSQVVDCTATAQAAKISLTWLEWQVSALHCPSKQLTFEGPSKQVENKWARMTGIGG